MSWDRPSGGDNDRPDRYDKGLDKNGERPFPGAPLDRPPAAPPTGPLPDWEEIKERRKAIPDHRDYARASASGYFDSDEWKNRKANAANAETEQAKVEPDSVEHVERADRLRDEPEAVDKPEATDKGADRNAERIEKLESELAKEREDKSKLIGVVSDQAAEIRRLRAELEKKTDQSAEGQTAVTGSKYESAEQDRSEQSEKPDRPWYKRVPVPSEKVTGLFTASATAVEGVGVATHSLSGNTETVIAGFIGLGVAGIAFERERRKEKKEKGQDG